MMVRRWTHWLSHSLLSRLTVLILLATLLAWAVFSAVLLYEARKETTELLDKQLAAYTQMLWQNLGDEDDLNTLPAQSNHHHVRLAFTLYHSDGSVQASNIQPTFPRQAPQSAGLLNLRLAGQDWRICVRQDQNRQLIVGEPLYHHRKIANEMAEHLGETALLALVILLPLLLLAIRRGLQPLRSVDAELAQRAPDNLSPLDLQVPSEIVPLHDRLNALFAQVSDTLARERRFTADAAHELRTPLAGLRVQIELAQSSPRPETRVKALGRALEGIDRTTRLVAQLLEMSRLEYGESPHFSPVNLGELAQQALRDAGLPSDDAHLQLNAPATIAGHALLLNLLLRNLLDNAKRYAGQAVQIVVQLDGDHLRVSDDGPGVDAETLQRLGERFYRPAGQTQLGAGLGLSIVLRIAQLHGAKVVFSNRTEGGFSVGIQFKAI
ncbi:two-component system sensor histidine kinase QseC [Chitinibacter fontanus]|uniref:histidine kinase n=1 Tax=Chitinibacter fontanus TaxID=1737446 RepID=A0A7D5V9V5_9NEIS|nr:ATP-binding protein [Chitinibacter fontanus]QLI81656.1 two-component system sensor histidine kinase QseC [Chitinibacter fontanus]